MIFLRFLILFTIGFGSASLVQDKMIPAGVCMFISLFGMMQYFTYFDPEEYR